MAGKQIFGVIEFYMEILLKVILKITLQSNQKPEFPNQIVHCTESSSSKTPFFCIFWSPTVNEGIWVL